ncbi:uncharacterized protein ARMOST_17478 [Armillaria ostoyae]|uniref:Uncharacterized protein n=1 Tax=Armillaria ostoyae TaxID=47428 RepID=A0A284RZ95_ARMOS|nr:uncharacterized protein ARMOST_17478 [Armillaria ostoyae]
MTVPIHRPVHLSSVLFIKDKSAENFAGSKGDETEDVVASKLRYGDGSRKESEGRYVTSQSLLPSTIDHDVRDGSISPLFSFLRAATFVALKILWLELTFWHFEKRKTLFLGRFPYSGPTAPPMYATKSSLLS